MVVDASVLYPAVLRPKGRAMAALLAAGSVEAPELFVLEVAASLRNRVLRSEVTADAAMQALPRLRRLPVARHPLMPLLGCVWELRDNLTPYDAPYIALAERLRVPLLTADKAVAGAPRLHCKVNLVAL